MTTREFGLGKDQSEAFRLRPIQFVRDLRRRQETVTRRLDIVELLTDGFARHEWIETISLPLVRVAQGRKEMRLFEDTCAHRRLPAGNLARLWGSFFVVWLTTQSNLVAFS